MLLLQNGINVSFVREKLKDKLKLIPLEKRIFLRLLPFGVLLYVIYKRRFATQQPLYSAQSREIFDAVDDKDYRSVLELRLVKV